MNHEAEAAYFRLIGSLLYNEPSEPVIKTLTDEKLFAELPYAADNGLAAKGQAQILGWLDSAPVNELTDNSRTDYMRLLVGAGKVLAPPWGSVYMNEDRLLFNEDTLKVRIFYQQHGMELKKKYSEPDDHIGLELEFIAHLMDNDKPDAARDFARQYIIPWVDQWNGDIQKHARTDYYRALANLTAGGIQQLMNDGV